MNKPQSLFSNNNQFQVAAFYCFFELSENRISSLKNKLIKHASESNILGTIILASEGLNGTVCGDISAVKKNINILNSILPEKEINFKLSYSKKQAFRRFKIKHKPEIVTMGVDKIDPNKEVGKYVDPKDWNKLASDSNTLVIDTRNEYEVGIGTFPGSLNPHTDNFREFPSWVREELKPYLKKNPKKKIAMFCTGGIRCEKATSLLLKEGFEDVNHLEGGILKYLEMVPKEESLWEGECFVFDQRVSLNHDLSPGIHRLCFACGMPLNPQERNSPSYIAGVQCDYCKGSFTDEDRARFSERQKYYDSKFKD